MKTTERQKQDPAKINTKDQRYLNSERSIQHALAHALSHRQINFHPQDICRKAGISAPTFYNHYRSSDDALRCYETMLTSEFEQAINNKTTQKEVIFVILLQFVAHHQHYFAATLTCHNNWLLVQILNSLRSHIVGRAISDKCFDIYIGRLSTLIFCWGKYEKFNRAKIPLYTQKLMQTRILELGI